MTQCGIAARCDKHALVSLATIVPNHRIRIEQTRPIRVMDGIFRMLHRLLAPMERILDINQLDQVSPAVVETARGSLVIGQA